MYTYIILYKNMYICTYKKCRYIYIYININICGHVYVCISIYMYISMSEHVHTHTKMYIDREKNKYTYIYIYRHTHVPTYTYTYTYISWASFKANVQNRNSKLSSASLASLRCACGLYGSFQNIRGPNIDPKH